mgnify:CR=1 FL=1
MVDGPIGVCMVTAALLVELAHKQGVETATHLHPSMEAPIARGTPQKPRVVKKVHAQVCHD